MRHADAGPDSQAAVTIVARAVGVDATVSNGGGTEVQLGALVRGLLAAGHNVGLICIDCAIPEQAGLSVKRLRVPRRPALLSFPWFTLRASWVAHGVSSGIIHSTGALVLGKVDVTTVHFCHRAYARRRLPNRASKATPWHRLNAACVLIMNTLMERWCYSPARTNRIVGPSQGVVRELVDCYPRTEAIVRVIPNGIDLERFRPASESERSERKAELGLASNAKLAIFVGGDWGRKGLVDAMKAVASAPEWHLLVVGSGDRQRYERIAIEAGVLERVHFHGREKQVQRLYHACDALVFPSEYEVASLVTYEAAACGLPLLVTRINGTEDFVVDGINGWFVDSAAAIGKRLQELSDDPRKHSEMRDAARSSSVQFDANQMVARYQELYDEVHRQLTATHRITRH